MGYRDVMQFPWGYHGWRAFKDPEHPKKTVPAGPVEGDFFPECRLALLQSAKDIGYLGLSKGTRYFSLSDIGSDHILLVVYNEMCTLCLEELPGISRLARLIDADEIAKDRVRILGLGAGSTKRSVAKFRKAKGYDLLLFADEKWKVFNALQKPVLPVLYLLKKINNGKLRIVFRYEGTIGSPQTFLTHLKRTITPAK